jgi:glycosyl hydrolase family 3
MAPIVGQHNPTALTAQPQTADPKHRKSWADQRLPHAPTAKEQQPRRQAPHDAPRRWIEAKHFVGYSASEGGLKTATTHLGSHKLHDLYAPPFEAAVGDGELQSVIDFHSPVDDIPVAASRAILTDSLGELAFPA